MEHVYDRHDMPLAPAAPPDGSYPTIIDPNSSGSDESDAQTTWNWGSAQCKAAPALKQTVWAAQDCGPCSRIVADISASPSFTIGRCLSKLSTRDNFSIISTSFDVSCESRSLISSLTVSEVVPSEPSCVLTARRSYHAETLRKATQISSKTEL